MDPDTVVSVILVIVLAAAIATFGNAVIIGIDDGGGESISERQAITLLDQDSFVNLIGEYGRGTNETVVNSRGLAMEFGGSDEAYVETSEELDALADQNWTVSQPVLNVNDTTETQNVLALGDPDLILQYVNVTGGTDQWSAVFMTATDSYRANVSVASTSTASFVYVERDGSNVTIYRNSTQGDVVNVSQDSSASGNLTSASNFNGTLDETRTFDTVLNSSKRGELRTNPVDPLGGTNRTSRLMYDEGNWTDTVYVFWASTDAVAGSDTAYVDGFAGSTMTKKDGALDSGDYRWRESGPQIKPTSGGQLNEAPVAYVEFDFEGAAARLRDSWLGAVSMLDVVFLVMLLSVAIGVLRTARK